MLISYLYRIFNNLYYFYDGKINNAKDCTAKIKITIGNARKLLGTIKIAIEKTWSHD